MADRRIRLQPGAALGSALQPGHFGVMAVLSIKTSLFGATRILGVRRYSRWYPAARSRLRNRSVAMSDFLCEAKPMDLMAR